MFPGSPAPLSPTTPLAAVLPLLPAGPLTGVWLRGSRGPRILRLRGGRRALLGRDLGVLLRRCDPIVVRVAGRPWRLSASQLVCCRVLEIVLGTPFLPPPTQLRELYPAMATERRGYAIPLGLGSAEEALGLCAAEGLEVRASRIRYCARSS